MAISDGFNREGDDLSVYDSNTKIMSVNSSTGTTLYKPTVLSGDGVTYFKERPRLELGRILGVSKPSIVYRGNVQGFSMPIYNSDNEELFFDIPCIPARWDAASDPILYVGGYLDTANTDKKFKIACDWTYFTAGTDVVVGTAVESPYVEVTTGTWAQYMSWQGTITLNYDVVPADALTVSDCLNMRLYRIAASSAEIAGEVVVTGCAIKWKISYQYQLRNTLLGMK